MHKMVEIARALAYLEAPCCHQQKAIRMHLVQDTPSEVLAHPPLLPLLLVADADALLTAANGQFAAARAPSHAECRQLQPCEHLSAKTEPFKEAYNKMRQVYLCRTPLLLFYCRKVIAECTTCKFEERDLPHPASIGCHQGSRQTQCCHVSRKQSCLSDSNRCLKQAVCAA